MNFTKQELIAAKPFRTLTFCVYETVNNKNMNWRKLFLITYWIRKNNFNAFTFLIDVYIILGALAFIIYVSYTLL